MKHIIFFAVCLATFTAYSQEVATSQVSGPVITWKESSYDFGDIRQGEKVEHTFVFTNTGNEPLIITNVQVTCGCTTPKGFPRDPIAPGETGEITVAFNSAGRVGKHHKVVTVVSNSVGKTNQISFTTNILKPENP
ncbi:MAG: DUF1573 domain-containing protein [Cyclobacteriaceae bacterium]|jgi:hypothetical protein|nr:DUF1573 domain-containing protein [Cyclobacteriaceae bacterium]